MPEICATPIKPLRRRAFRLDGLITPTLKAAGSNPVGRTILTKRYRCVWRKARRIYTVSVHKEVFSYERLVATSAMEAAAFSLFAVDHGLDDSAIASISFMVARSTSPTPVKWMSMPTRLCPFNISLL